jgi:hypothetical protein
MNGLVVKEGWELEVTLEDGIPVSQILGGLGCEGRFIVLMICTPVLILCRLHIRRREHYQRGRRHREQCDTEESFSKCGYPQAKTKIDEV